MGVHLPWKKIIDNSRTAGNFLWNLDSVSKVFLETCLAPSKNVIWDISACTNCDFYGIIVFYALWQPNLVWQYLLMTFFFQNQKCLSVRISNEFLMEFNWLISSLKHSGLILHLLRHFYFKFMFSRLFTDFS